MLVYLHGFNSSPRSFKATLLKQKLDTLKLGHLFACPALPHRPAQAMRLLEQRMQAVDSGALTLIGSSLGGFYATYLVEKYPCKAVLVILRSTRSAIWRLCSVRRRISIQVSNTSSRASI